MLLENCFSARGAGLVRGTQTAVPELTLEGLSSIAHPFAAKISCLRCECIRTVQLLRALPAVGVSDANFCLKVEL